MVLNQPNKSPKVCLWQFVKQVKPLIYQPISSKDKNTVRQRIDPISNYRHHFREKRRPNCRTMDWSSWFRRNLLKNTENSSSNVTKSNKTVHQNQKRTSSEEDDQLFGINKQLIDHIKSFTFETFKDFSRSGIYSYLPILSISEIAHSYVLNFQYCSFFFFLSRFDPLFPVGFSFMSNLSSHIDGRDSFAI